MDQGDSDRDGSGKLKPIPIREAVGEPAPRRGAKPPTPGSLPTSQAPGLRGQRERPRGPDGRGSSRSEGGNQSQRPDRKGAARGGERPSRPPLEPTPLQELPSRRFEHDGGEWIVRLCGQTSTGSAQDPGALLMHLVFYSAADPLVGRGEVLTPADSLDDFPEVGLRELLAAVESPLSVNKPSG